MSKPSSRQDTSPQPEIIHITPQTPGQRLDVAVAAHLDRLSRAQVQRLIKDGHILVDGAPAKASYRLEGGEEVTVRLPRSEARPLEAEAIPLSVLYEDDDLIAINKTAGMVVHPATGHQTGTLVNAALARWPGLRDVGGEEHGGVVHRLDKDTSGAILLAKTDAALADLQGQFKRREVQKRYLALVEGVPESSEGIVDAPLGRDPRRRKRMAVVKEGREAVTHYRLLEAFEEHSLLEIHPKTGRTHQIRVHLAWLGHPVVGDRVYGYRKQRLHLKRHWLHAAALTVRSPSSGEPLTFEAPLPPDLKHVLETLR